MLVGSPATWRLLAPSWIGGEPTTSGEAASSMELIPAVNPRRLPRQVRGMSQAAPGARSRRKRGVRARSAIPHTAPGEGASASSTPDSGPEDSARGRRAQRATRRSDGAPHHAPLTAVTHCRRCSPARQACRAGLTPPAAGPDRKLASPRHLPPSRRASELFRHTRSDRATSIYTVGQRHPSWARAAPIGRVKPDKRHPLIGGAEVVVVRRYPAVVRSALSSRSRLGPTSTRTWMRLIVPMPGRRCRSDTRDSG
jgi:hypothetical protein